MKEVVQNKRVLKLVKQDKQRNAKQLLKSKHILLTIGN